MPELRQLDLELTFEAACALRKDVENQAGAVQYAALQQRFEIPLLAGRQRMIEQDQVGALALHARANLLGLAAADEQSGVGRASGSSDQVKDLGAG